MIHSFSTGSLSWSNLCTTILSFLATSLFWMLAIKELLDSFYHMVVQRLYLFRGGGPHAVQCSAERHAGVCQPG
jgi:hypothetical protein